MTLLFSTSVDVEKAKVELVQVLEWMRRTKTSGGLGYSVSRVQTTHAYRALVALQGVWP